MAQPPVFNPQHAWTSDKAKGKYGVAVGAAERVHPGIQSAKTALKAEYEKWDTVLSKGSLVKPADKDYLFPARYYTKTEEEKNWQLQTEATAALGKKLPSNVQIQTQLPDKYKDWIEAKQKAEFFVNFDKWIEQSFLDGDLAKREFIHQVYPEYFEAREAEVAAKLELDKKIFDIKLHGSKDASDLRLEYLLRTGAIVPDPTPIWDTSSVGKSDAALRRGFFSTHKWLLNNPAKIAEKTDLPWSTTGVSTSARGGDAPGTKAGLFSGISLSAGASGVPSNFI